MNFKQATEAFPIVSCSTIDASPRDLCVMTLPATLQYIYYSSIACGVFVLNKGILMAKWVNKIGPDQKEKER